MFTTVRLQRCIACALFPLLLRLQQPAAAEPQLKRPRASNDSQSTDAHSASSIVQLLTGSSSSASTAAAVEALQIQVQPIEDGVTSTSTSSGLTSPPPAPRRSGWSHADSSILDKAEAAVKAAVSTTLITITTRITISVRMRSNSAVLNAVSKTATAIANVFL
jgi:hypothetical protein